MLTIRFHSHQLTHKLSMLPSKLLRRTFELQSKTMCLFWHKLREKETCRSVCLIHRHEKRPQIRLGEDLEREEAPQRLGEVRRGIKIDIRVCAFLVLRLLSGLAAHLSRSALARDDGLTVDCCSLSLRIYGNSEKAAVRSLCFFWAEHVFVYEPHETEREREGGRAEANARCLPRNGVRHADKSHFAGPVPDPTPSGERFVHCAACLAKIQGPT